jgi:hypothetical protein
MTTTDEQTTTTALATTEAGGELIQQETSTAAAAALATAQIQARFAVAYRNPRNLDDVRASLLRDCDRSSFARVARYRLPFGDEVEGWTIRFAEAAVLSLGNVDIDSPTIYDDDDKRIVEVMVTDLERNITYRKAATITKTKERGYAPRDVKPLGVRKNSQGKTVYILPADEREVRQKEGAEVSKLIRTLGLRLIPGWLLDECLQRVQRTLRAEVEQDPDKAKKQILDAFSSIGVKPSDLVEFLGKSLDAATSVELVELRGGEQAGGDSEEDDAAKRRIRDRLAEHKRSRKGRKSQPKASEPGEDEEPPMREPGEEG